MTPVWRSTRWKYWRDSVSSKSLVFMIFSSQGALTKYTPSCWVTSTWPRWRVSTGARAGASGVNCRMGGSLARAAEMAFKSSSTPWRMGAMMGKNW